MASASLDQRAAAVTRRIAELDPAEPPSSERIEALALGLVDALLDGDAATLRTALDALRAARARANGDVGSLDALIAVAHWGLERVPDTATVAHGTRAWDFLDALAGAPQLGSAALREILETDETQVSRTGRQLLEAGLVTRSRAGRNVYWQISPRGRRALEAPAEEPAPPERDTSFWMEAIRRGFEGAGGDEPGERRSVDPTRERIVESTLELHTMLGIAETTLPDIAKRAGVTIETIEQLFPTQDDLIKGCGQHLMTSLRLPPPERAAEIFAGTRTREERMRRLVDTLFDVYERQGQYLQRGHMDRAGLPLVDDAMSTVDVAIDSLVSEALGPEAAGERSVASVRALTDLTVWKSMREQGASPEASAEHAADAVQQWLEGQPMPGGRRAASARPATR